MALVWLLFSCRECVLSSSWISEGRNSVSYFFPPSQCWLTACHEILAFTAWGRSVKKTLYIYVFIYICTHTHTHTHTHIHNHACTCAQSLQLCPTLCDHMDHSLPGSSVHGILQSKNTGVVVMPFSRESFRPRDRFCVSYVLSSALAGGFLTTSVT